MNRRSIAAALGVGALVLVAGGAAADVSSTALQQPLSVTVFQDDFNSPSTYATYKPLGAASVKIDGGRLYVQVDDATGKSGLSMRLPAGGVGVRCLSFDGLDIPIGDIGSILRWTWFGFDDTTGQEVVVLETEIERTGSLTIRHRKADGTLVEQHFPDKDFSDIDSKRWDTRRNGTQVQLEIKWKDGTKYNSDWMDPSASTIAGFDVTTDLPGFSVDGTGGNEVHTTESTADPVMVTAFEPSVGGSQLHWMLEGKDADQVVVGTVLLVRGAARAIPDDPRRRVEIEILPRATLLGPEMVGPVRVLHAVRGRLDLSEGDDVLLFLRDGREISPEAGWLWDYGLPVGVIPFTQQNLEAVRDRLHLLYGE